MISLLLATISMGILDSFNPVALTQQFLLQGMVKKRRHVLYYTFSVGLTNLVGGLLIYYGLDRVIDHYWSLISTNFAWLLPPLEITGGILALIYVACRRINKKFSEILSAHIEKCEPEEKKDPGSNIKSVAPLALVMLGMFAVLCEIPTSLPYFAFLAALLQFELSFPILLGVLVLYNFLFTLPLYLMYILYLKCKKKVDRLYHFLNDRLFRYGTILLPVLAAIIGVGLILHAGYTLYFC